MILTPKEISYLSASFKGQNPLSPFSNITETPDGNEYDSLCEKGIIVNNGYDEKALDMLQRLTNPEMSASLVIQSDFYLVQKFTYKTGDRLILAENQRARLSSANRRILPMCLQIYISAWECQICRPLI